MRSFAEFREEVGSLERSISEATLGLDVARYIHLSLGHEVAAWAITRAIAPASARWALYYRCHAWLLALGVPPATILDEVLGEGDASPLRARAGSMHLMLVERVIDANSIVGAQVPIAVGAAAGARVAGRDEAVVCVLGDGATTCGPTLESINIAAQQQLQLLFVVEDNGIAINSRYSELSKSTVQEKLVGLGLHVTLCDGDDCDAVEAAATDARDLLRRGPRAIVVRVVREGGHHLAADVAATRSYDPPIDPKGM